MDDTKFNQWREIETRLTNNSIFRGLVYPNVRGALNTLFQCWFEPHRFYHGIGHLHDIFQQINMEDFVFDGYPELMEVIAVFHDAVYTTGTGTRAGADNEEASIAFFHELAVNDNFVEEKKEIETAIMDSKNGKGRSIASRAFQCLDRAYLNTEKPLHRVIEIEHGIFKEYQFVDFSIYKNKRIDFLESQQNEENFEYLELHLDFLHQWLPRIGVYAGSFDPWHVGHDNIFGKLEKLFDKGIIAIGSNPKPGANADLTSRMLSLQNRFPHHQIEVIPGLTPRYLAEKAKTVDVTLVRGLRSIFDLQAEMVQLRHMEDMYPELKIMYIPCDRQFEYISSSGIRTIQAFDPKEVERYKP